MQEPVPGISAVPDEANARYFHVVVAGMSIYGVTNLWNYLANPFISTMEKDVHVG